MVFQFFSECKMPTKILVLPTFRLPPHLAINEGIPSFTPEPQATQHGERHSSTTGAVPARLSRGLQQRTARHTMTLLPRAPGDTGPENYGVKKLCLVQSIVFQVDSVWKENSIKQLCCTEHSV